jgi:hypothetical protein
MTLIEDIFLSAIWLEISIFFEPEKCLCRGSLSSEEKNNTFCVVFVLVLV